MTIDLPMNVRSILDLVASDFAYKSGTQNGELLRTFPDSESAYENGFPTSLALNLRQEPLTQYNDFQQNGVRGIELPQWKVAHVIEDSGDGFGAVVLKSTIRGSDGKFDYIVAFRGTDGLDGQDWFANLDLAAAVWDSHSLALIDYLTSLQDDNDKPSLNRIHFTGQSLGGGLAQYAAYDYALAVRGSNPAFRQDMTLTTFNSFGGVRGLQQLARLKGRPSQYDPNILANVVTAHYSIENDIVHRLGAGAGQVADVGGSWHVNGAGNTYQFRFRRYDNGVRVAGSQNFLGIVEGHRIESGFYRGFQNYPINFLKAEPEKIAYIDGETSLSLAAAWSRVGNKGFTTELSAWTRVAVGGAAIAIAGDVREINQAASTLAEALYKSGDTPVGIGATKAGILALVGVVRLHNTGVISGKIASTVFARYLERRAGLQPEEKRAAIQALNSFLPANRQLAESDVVGDANESSATRNFRADLASIVALSFAETDTDVSQFLINPRYAELARKLRDITKNSDRLADALSGTNWLADTLTELRAEAIASFSSDIDKEKKFANFSVQVASFINDVKLATAQQDATFLASIGTTLQNFVREIGGILSSLPIDVIPQSQAAQTELGTNTLTFQKFDEIRDIVAEAAQNTANAGIERAIDEALETIESAGQTIFIAQGRPQNPFDAETFDPDGTQVALGAILEGEVRAFTVFLPYEAQEGGQHVSLTLGGSAAGKFVVLLDADPIEPHDDGEFDLLIDEGSRSISFGLWAQGDVDTDETLSLSATLVDTEGNATHLTHLELNLALDAESEAPPMGGREIRGDWAPKPYTDPVTGETFAYRWDELSNVERDSGVPNTTGFSEPDNKLDGSPGPDHIVTGDYEDRAYGFEGDDSITGSALLINILHGGAGNDWIEALGSSSHATDYFEFELDGRVIKLGQGKISGGAGDDYIYGESAESLDRLYDQATLPTGLPGNWSSGGSGGDHIYGTAGDDVLMGGIGKDLLVGGAGQDVILGDDNYWLYNDLSFWRVVHPNFDDLTPGLGGFEFGLFPVVNATESFPDMVFQMTGDPDFTYYKNGGAADVLIGGAGRDILIGQYGDDALYGGDDDDILAGWEGADELYGGEGNDLMAGDFGRYEEPNQRGVAAPDLAPAGVRNPANSDGSVVDQSGRDFLDGGAGNDILFGEGGDDILLGGAGNDTLYGDAAYLPDELHGADTLDGGVGNDVLVAHAGNDKLYGGAGDDTLEGGSGNDFLDGGTGNDSLAGGEGDDALEGGDGADTLTGGAGDDVLRGGEGNDQLDGGDGDDVLFAGEGENRLEGGDGNDTLYGGSLGDILSGGVGNDRIDAGAGIDIVYGGEGNDTYVLDFNYGRDLFEDAEGANRIEFGAGIAPEQITAEWAGSALTVAYGFGEDAFTMDLAQFQLGGIDFADGTSWTKKNLVNVAPRVLTAGSDEAETVEGVLYGRNDLQGLGGNDLIMGAGYDDLLSGGAGADTLDGAGGSDRYFFTADESGIDRISDSELAGRAYLDWFYENLGIADWEGRALHGGKFEVSFLDEGGDSTFYYDTYEEAFTDYLEAIITHIEPLPEATPLITRNDTDALDQLVNAGVLARDVVEFGPGLTLADLELSINVDGTLADQHPEQPWYGGGTLSVRWGDAGFDLQIPDVNYGFVGSNLLTDGIDSSYDESAGSWRGYRLGEGVETFEFTDGGTYSLEEILQQATVVARYGYEFLRGSGYQVIDRNQDSVYFEAGIQASEVQVTSNGADLLITLTDGSAQGRIVDWYADPATVPSITLRFTDGSELDTDSITRLGLTRYGTEAPDFLQADSDFAHALYGLGGPDTLIGLGGNDFLDGGEGDDYLDGGLGNDIYVFQRGDGQDGVYDWDETPGNIDTVRFGADVAFSDVTVSGENGDLILSIDGIDDQVVLQYWFWDDESKIEQVAFADGTVWNIAALESMVPMADATEDADLIFGTSGDDSIDGLGGDDEIIGGSGNDILSGGEGVDYLIGGLGNDILLGGEGADELEDWSGSDYLNAGSGDDSIIVNGGASFIIGGSGTDWIENFSEAMVIAFNAGDGQDTIYAASSLTLSLGGGIHAADLSLRREGTDFVLETGATDSIRFTRQWEQDPKAWPQMTLQLIDGAVSTYDLNEIINQYNGLQNADPTLTRWQIGDALASALLDSSTGFALGGDLAYRYASTGSNDGLAPDVIRGIISDVAFGVEPQPFEALAPTNHAPGIDVPLADQGATEDAPFAFTLPSDAFFDPDTNDALTISATLSDGSPLPEWLSFDGAGFSGTPENADVNSIEVEVTATDGGGLSVSDAFMLNVVNVNDAPTLANAIAGQDTLEDAVFSFVVPADAFADVDVGDVLTYGATLANGSALPAWLSFDATQAAFSGTPENGDVGTLEVRVTATDQSGAYVANDFTLIVGNTNDAPEVASVIADPSTLEDAPFTFTLPADTFADVDLGDALTFSATLADGSPLPAWLTFDPATQAFTGTPGNDEVGTLSITVTATDTADARAADTFDLTVVNVNDAPVLINHQQKQWAADGDIMQFQLPGNPFNDIDAGDTLSYSATADGASLPAWLAFDAETRTFSGTPDEADIGTLSLSVTATDTSGATASDSFDLEVTVAPDRMLTGTGSDDLLSGRSGSDTLYGLAGDDALFGRSGNDRLSGGPGDDLLAGGTGDDTYVYQAGDGLDTIADESGSDTAAFGAGLTRDNVVARMSGDNSTARVRVLDAYDNEQPDQGLDIAFDPAGGSPIEWFTFATGAPATLDDLLIRQEVHTGTRRNDIIRTGRNDDAIYADRGNDVIYAGTGNDVLFGDRGRDLLYGEAGNDVLAGGRGKDKLYGGFGDDVLDGGRGTDILDGGAGFNTYIFERNFGDDRIVRGSGSGALRFGAGITARDLSFKRRNDDLVVKVKGEGRIRIEGWFDADAAHPVSRAEFADGTVLNADKFVAKGHDSERERDEDDDDEDGSHDAHDDDGARPHGATHNEDHDDVYAKKTAPDRGKSSDRSGNEWFDKVVEKWDAHYARSAQPNAESGDARSGPSHGAQPGNRWQHMHNRLNAHLADGLGDDDNGGADLASLRPGSAHGPSFAQFGSIGYGGVGVADRGAADLRPFAGLKEGLARIA